MSNSWFDVFTLISTGLNFVSDMMKAAINKYMYDVLLLTYCNRHGCFLSKVKCCAGLERSKSSRENDDHDSNDFATKCHHLFLPK